MKLDHELAHDYFASSTPRLWGWKDDGEVVAWSDGSTIAFRAEIGVILSRLEQLGLPRFGAIVLLVGACRESWSSATCGRKTLGELLSYFPGPKESYLLCREVLEGLERVHELRDLLTYPAAKAELVAFIFEAAKYLWPSTPTSAVVRAFWNGLPPATFFPPNCESADAILADAADLRSGLARVNRESLEQRLKIGFEQQIKPAPADIPPGVSARELIRQLSDDEELGGVARLARLLLAAVQLPRPLHDPEELPIGGVTDITNRGPLDRLMLSELAHDDLTLAVRVAMNEALYLRREPVARALPRHRFVLIDSGLRLWGVPRVFATAVGLAIAAQADKNLEVSQWRACGNRIVPVDFTTEQGLTAHLAELEHRVHPGESLSAFVKAIESDTVPSDAILITSEDVLADREFCKDLDSVNLDSLHIAAVQRDGTFRLMQRTLRGNKILRTAQFSLDEILAPRVRSATSLVDSRILPSLPAIYGVDPFPLRLSVPVRLENSWFVTAWDCLVTLTNDGRLLRWDGQPFGAWQIAEGLPAGQIHCCTEVSPDGKITLVVGKLSQRGLYAIRFNANTRSVRLLQLTVDQPRVVTIHQGVILVISAKEVNALDPATGALLHAREHEYHVTRWGRFVPLQPSLLQPGRLGSTRWAAISFDGTKIQYAVLDRPTVAAPPLLAVFDAPALPNGPVGITATAELVFLGDDRQVAISGKSTSTPCEVRAVSRDGLRVVLGATTGRDGRTLLAAAATPNSIAHQILVHVVAARGELVFGDPRTVVEELRPELPPRGLRRHFRGILVEDKLDRLTLVSRKGSLWPIALDSSRNAIVIPKLPAALRPGDLVPFESIDKSCTGGRMLSVARWPDGSTAVLDHLGMLNLRSSDRTIPECTIVLQEGVTSGWVADGRFWGESYFIGANVVTSAKVIWDEVLRPFVHRIQVHQGRS